MNCRALAWLAAEADAGRPLQHIAGLADGDIRMAKSAALRTAGNAAVMREGA